MKTRAIIASLLAIGIVTGLTACETGPGGPETLAWIQKQPNVESATLHYEPDIVSIPIVVATIKPSASNAALRNLAASANTYFRKHNEDAAELTLKLPTATLDMGGDNAERIPTEWIALHDDPRILKSDVSSDTMTAHTTRANAVPVFTSYVNFAHNVPITIVARSSSHNGLQVADGYNCTPTAAELRFATKAVTNPLVVGTRLDLCGTSTVAASTRSKMLTVASQLHAGAPLFIRMIVDSPTDTYYLHPTFDLSLKGATPPRLAFLRSILVGTEFTGAKLTSNGSLTLRGSLPSASEPVFSDSGTGSVASITIDDKKLAVGGRNQSGFDANYRLAVKLAAIGSSTHVSVTPDDITVDMHQLPGGQEDDYAKYGKRELKIIVGSSLWQQRQVLVETEYHQGVVFADGTASETGPSHPSNPILISYWNSLTH